MVSNELSAPAVIASGHRSHEHVIGGLPQVVAVVCAEGVPEPVELATDRLDVGLRGRPFS